MIDENDILKISGSNMMSLRNVSKNERTGQRGKELTCPHCQSKWLAGHLNWVAVTCMHCKKDVNKYAWLCNKD